MREFKQVYPLQQVLDLIGPWGKHIDGDYIRLGGLRLYTFKTMGVKCVNCGIEGAFFCKERDDHSPRFFMQLYAVTVDGGRVLMTKDHIKPLSKGGKNYAGNVQPMCAPCNERKADTWISMPIQAPTKRGHWDVPQKIKKPIETFRERYERKHAYFAKQKISAKDSFINWLYEWRF